MVAASEIKERMMNFLRLKGPSLPIQIARDLGMDSLFVSAFLSELVDDKKVKVSSLKVGGSPLYFLAGQEKDLERFYNYMHPKEAEAFILLKDNKVLRDSEQEPAIRVALRAIKDFSAGFNRNSEIFWRYLQIPEEEAFILSEKKYFVKSIDKESIEEKKPIEIKNENVIEIKEEKEGEKEDEKAEEKTETKEEKPKKPKRERVKKEIKENREISEFKNPLAAFEKPKKEKEKSEFALKVIDFLKENHFKIIEEIEHGKKEYKCIVQMNSILGPINFLTEAKEKKTVTDADLQKFLSEAQAIPLPALVLYTGELSKKAAEYYEKYFSILKTKKIE